MENDTKITKITAMAHYKNVHFAMVHLIPHKTNHAFTYQVEPPVNSIFTTHILTAMSSSPVFSFFYFLSQLDFCSLQSVLLQG